MVAIDGGLGTGDVVMHGVVTHHWYTVMGAMKGRKEGMGRFRNDATGGNWS